MGKGAPSESTFRALAGAAFAWRDPDHPARREAVRVTLSAGNRFTEPALAYAINQQMHQVTVAALARWKGGREVSNARVVGVLGAGNVPLASFQDYVAVLVMGHSAVLSESSRSPAIMPAFAAEVTDRGGPPARFVDHERFFSSVEAVIASGSSDTIQTIGERCETQGIPASRRLLRGTRYGMAVLDGRETPDQRIRWAEDVLLHEGLGCRNVAITFAPRGLDVDPYLETLAVFRGTFPAHPGTSAGLKMQQAFLKAIGASFAQGEGLEFLVSRGAAEPQPPGHLRWVEYDVESEVTGWLEQHADEIQVVATRPALERMVPRRVERCNLGETQRPPLDWRPDGIDTMDFLARI